MELTAQDFDLAVRSLASIVDTVHAEQDRVPEALNTVGAFFDFLSDPMRLPGPDGTTLTALKGFITVDLCLVYGICLLPGGAITRPSSAPSQPSTPVHQVRRERSEPSGLDALADLLLLSRADHLVTSVHSTFGSRPRLAAPVRTHARTQCTAVHIGVGRGRCLTH